VLPHKSKAKVNDAVQLEVRDDDYTHEYDVNDDVDDVVKLVMTMIVMTVMMMFIIIIMIMMINLY